MVYVRHKVIIDLHYEKYFPGLNIAVVEPTGDMWEKVIIPRLDMEGSIEDPLKWIDVFIACLDSWDLKKEDGTSTPCTRAGLMGYDLDFIRIVVRHWLTTAILVRRDEYGNLLSEKTNQTEEVFEEGNTPDPLREDVKAVLDLPEGVVVPMVEPSSEDGD